MIDDLIKFDAMQNIADEVDLDLDRIGSDVVEGFESDLVSRQGWDGDMKLAMDLALQIKEKKTFPWEGASNVKMPLMTEAAMHFNSMMYPALVPSVDIVKGRIVGMDPTGEKQQSAIRVSKHMSFQVLEEMEEWEEEMDIGLMIQPILGNMYKKAYYDNNKVRNVSEMLSPKEFVVNYNAKNIESAFRKTHIIPMNKNDIRKEVLAGNFIDADLGSPVQKDKEIKGQTPSKTDLSTPYDILEVHTYLDLDEDDLLEPYIVTVDRSSRKVLRIVTGFDIDQVLADKNGAIIDAPQEQYFIKYGFIPNPDGGVLDLGLGKLLGPTNESVNTLINQLIDAGTRSNMGGGFIGRGMRIKGGVLKFSMGEYKQVDSSGMDLSRNIVHLPVNQPSNVLFQLLGMLINAGQRISSTLDSQVGENPGQNQKATTSAIVQEAGQKIFNGIYKRCLRSLKKEFKRLFYLNSKYLPAESYLNVLDGKFPPELQRVIKRIDYDMKSVNIIPAADSSYQSQSQKMTKAQLLMQKIGTGMVNPKVAMRAVLEAEEQPNIDQIMNVPPAPPSMETIQFEHNAKLDWAKYQLDVIKAQQDDVKIQTEAILNLARAEGEERGSNLNEYKAQLEFLLARSKQLGERAASIGSPEQGRDESMEESEPDEMGEAESQE